MKKIGTCVLMATVAMGAEREKSTLEINWKNNKGETKTFKVDDIEKEFNPEEIKSKSFIQGNVLPLSFSELKEREACPYYGASRSRSLARRSYRSCSGSRGRSFRSGRSCRSRSLARSGGYRSGSRSRRKSFRSGRSCRSRSLARRSGSRGLSRGGYRSLSRGRSLGSRSRGVCLSRSRRGLSGSRRVSRSNRRVASVSGSRGGSRGSRRFASVSRSRRFGRSLSAPRSLSRGAYCSRGASLRQGDGSASCSRRAFSKKSGCSYKSGSLKRGIKLTKAKGSCFAELNRYDFGGERACSYDKGSVCSYGKGGNYYDGDCYDKGGVCSYGKGGNYYDGDYCGKGSVCRYSRSRSKSFCGDNKYYIQHQPKYIYRNKYIPKNKLHKYNKFNRNISKCKDSVDNYKKDYDTNIKKVSLDDLQKLLKLNKNSKDNLNVQKKSASKFRKNQQISKFLKDAECKNVKNNNERKASCDYKNAFKNTKKRAHNKTKQNDKERQHSLEAKKCHNVVNLNHKANEALLMKEQDKDNLHSNDRVVEEFDKLEHFRKVEERCRNASKSRAARVKKHQDLDKCQAQKQAQKHKERRNKDKRCFNLKKNNDCFYNLDKDNCNRNSNYLKDENECKADKLRERSFSYKSAKSTCSADEKNICQDKKDTLDLVNKKNKKYNDKKKICIDDDENCYKRKNSKFRSNEDKFFNKDACFNDVC